MAVRLTDTNVRTLPARDGKRTDYRDAVVRRFTLRVSPPHAGGPPEGDRTYAVVYGYAGRVRRYTIGSVAELSLADARAKAKELLARVALGEDVTATKVREREAAKLEGDLTFKALAADFLRWAEKHYRPATFAGWRRFIEVDLEPLHQRPPAEITRGEVRKLINSIATRSGWVANRVLEVVRRVYSWSVENDRVAASPVVGIRKPHDEEPSERVLSTEEIHAVWRALDFIEPDHADIIRLLFLTGVRPHAILGMRRRELEQLDDPKSARWTIPGGLSGREKNRKPHTVPLVSQALDIIKPRLEQRGQEYVFPPHRAGRSPHRLFSSKVARALRIQVDAVAGRKLPRWRVYDIRHTVATRLREDLKVSRDIVSLVLGHIQGGPEATRVYDRAELLSERRAALRAWAAWLRRVVLKPPQKKPIGLVEAARR